MRIRMENPMDGIINLDKSPGPSSAAVVNSIKRLFPRKTKIGHAGTLDPFATGVLLILVGKATKACESLMDQPKQYETTIRLGATTPTDDPESPQIITSGALEPSLTHIEQSVQSFTGTILQHPPAYSAIKIGGKRSYDLARHGQPIELPARPVHVDQIQILSYQWPLLKLLIDCGRGTYIRAIARDLGAALGVGGHLTQLRRLKVGQFKAETAVSLERLKTDGVDLYLKPLSPNPT
jgi:tRNA pseudouridine55 synthase